MQHYVIKFVSDLQQVGGFLRVLRFPPSIKLTPRYNWNIVKGGVKHQNKTNPFLYSFLFENRIKMYNHKRVKPKTNMCIGCFPTKHAALRSKNKDWFAWNQDNVSEWSDISIRGLLWQWDIIIKIQLSVLVYCKEGIIINSPNVSCSCHDMVDYLVIKKPLI